MQQRQPNQGGPNCASDDAAESARVCSSYTKQLTSFVSKRSSSSEQPACLQPPSLFQAVCLKLKTCQDSAMQGVWNALGNNGDNRMFSTHTQREAWEA